MILTYDPSHGIVVPDEDIEEFLIRNKDFAVIVSSGTMVDGARALYKEGKIPVLRIFFENRELSIDSNGRISNWPHGFCDVADKFLSRLARQV